MLFLRWPTHCKSDNKSMPSMSTSSKRSIDSRNLWWRINWAELVDSQDTFLYLTECNVYVRIYGTISDPFDITSGEPQGSHLLTLYA